MDGTAIPQPCLGRIMEEGACRETVRAGGGEACFLDLIRIYELTAAVLPA